MIKSVGGERIKSGKRRTIKGGEKGEVLSVGKWEKGKR